MEYATGKGNKLTVHGTIEQNTIPAQIVATEPAIEKLGEPDDIAITGANPDHARREAFLHVC